MDRTEEIREEVTMRGNIKTTDNKKGDDSTETENSEKSKHNKISEPSLDKPNPKNMKITLPLSKSDDHSFSNMSRLSQEDFKIPKMKKKDMFEKLLSSLFDKGNFIFMSFGLGLSNDGSDPFLLFDFSEFSVSVESSPFLFSVILYFRSLLPLLLSLLLYS